MVPEYKLEHSDTPFSLLKATPIPDKSTSPVKRGVIRTVVGKHNKTVNE